MSKLKKSLDLLMSAPDDLKQAYWELVADRMDGRITSDEEEERFQEIAKRLREL